MKNHLLHRNGSLSHQHVSPHLLKLIFDISFVLPVSSQSAMTCVEPQKGTNVHIKYRLPPVAGERPHPSASPRGGDRLYFSCQGNSGGAAQRSEVTGSV